MAYSGERQTRTDRRRHCQSKRPALASERHGQSLEARTQGPDCQAAGRSKEAGSEEACRRQEEALQGSLIGRDPGLGSSFAARFHDASAGSSFVGDGRARRTRPEHLLVVACGYMIDVLFAGWPGQALLE